MNPVTTLTGVSHLPTREVTMPKEADGSGENSTAVVNLMIVEGTDDVGEKDIENGLDKHVEDNEDKCRDDSCGLHNADMFKEIITNVMRARSVAI